MDINGERRKNECVSSSKTITRVDPSCLGGVRLEFDGKQLDDTVEHRLAAIGSVLKSTVL